MTSTAVAYVALLGLSAAITGGVAVYAWRHRDEPGARPFALLMASASLWAACSAATLLAHDVGTHRFIEQIQWVGIKFLPVFWVLFALSYTGYEEFISPRTTGALSVLPLMAVVVLLIPQWNHLVWNYSSISVVNGVAIGIRDVGILFWASVLYSHLLIGIGALLLIRLVVVSDYLFRDQSALLLVGIIVPLGTNTLALLDIVSIPGLDIAPFTFAISGLAIGYALFRQQLLDLVPATRRLGRDAAIADLDDGVLILDSDSRIIYLNTAAAAVLDCERSGPLGESMDQLVDSSNIDFDTPDGVAELQIDNRVHEARSSTITDRQDRNIGHTLVLHDITERKQRERRLRRQRDTLEVLDRLNQLVREITQAFVTTTSRTAIENIVCDRLGASDLYAEASIVLDPSDEIVVGDGGRTEMPPDTSITVPVSGSKGKPNSPDSETLPEVFDTDHGSWSVVSLGYGRSIYGALVLYTTRSDAFNSRERAVLNQFGDTISQAIDAVENQQLLLADTVTELTFRCPDSVLAAVAEAADCNLSLNGLVPAGEDELLVYSSISDGSVDRVVEVVSGIDGITASRVQSNTDGVVQFAVSDRSALLAFSTGGTNVRTAETVDEGCEVVVEVTPESDIRALTERVQEYCPAATLIAKHNRDRSVETSQLKRTPEDVSEGFTERQRDVFEAAYRAGYFESPRTQTAEEVAESINISSPTFHKHLRSAEEQLGEKLFNAEDG